MKYQVLEWRIDKCKTRWMAAFFKIIFRWDAGLVALESITFPQIKAIPLNWSQSFWKSFFPELKYKNQTSISLTIESAINSTKSILWNQYNANVNTSKILPMLIEKCVFHGMNHWVVGNIFFWWKEDIIFPLRIESILKMTAKI